MSEDTVTEPVVVVKRNELTYHRGARASYFRDLALKDRDAAALSRLDRHAREMDVELERREKRAAAAAGDEFEYRVNPDRTQGQGGYFAPPLWLIEQFATAKRPQRVLSELVKGAGGWFPLPKQVQSVNLPRLTAGTTTLDEPDLDPDADTDIVDASVTSPVVPIDGQSDVSLQDLEQSPPSAALDWAIWKDLTDSYDAELETLLLTGTGLAGQWLGLMNIVGINAVTFTTATPFFSSSATAANNLYPYMGQASAQIGDNRSQAPEAWLMRSARWSWIATSNDNQGRPIVPPDLQPPPASKADGTIFPISSVYGWPVFIDEAIPATQGVGANQDSVIVCLPSDLLLWEGDPITAVFVEVLSGTLGARIQLRNYAAAILGRYPTGIATVTGTGMVVQSGF